MMVNFKNRDAFLKICRDFYYDMVDLDPAAAGDSSLSQPSVEHGKIRLEFARFLKPLFDKELGDNGKLLGSLSEAELKDRLNNINSKVRDFPIKEGNLGDYSPWLKNFKRNPAKDLEIPGYEVPIWILYELK